MIEQFLTTEQVSNILQVHPFTILKFIKEGKLKGVKLGRVYRIKESDVHEFLENRSTGKHATNRAQSAQAESRRGQNVPQSGTPSPEPFKLEKGEKGKEGPHYYII